MTEKIMAQCMRCKKQVEMGNPNFTTNARGLNVAIGNCLVCKTKMYRILPKIK